MLNEKENYIDNLENQISEMRREIEKQKPDINTISESAPITSQASFIPLDAAKATLQNSIYNGQASFTALNMNAPASPKYL